jgi:exodeoxyribonuclease VII large subunit
MSLDDSHAPQLSLLTYTASDAPAAAEAQPSAAPAPKTRQSSSRKNPSSAQPDPVPPVADHQHDALTVSELTEYLSQVVQNDPLLGFPVTVRAEVTGVNKSSRGHIYFSLKDDSAVLKAKIWAGPAKALKFDLKDGLEVFATGKIDIYAPQGTYSLTATRLEPVGVGALQLALEQLKAQLEAEGLFDPARKRVLPSWPQRIGIVTSATGSVIHDMLRVIRRKTPHLSVLIAPATVQGDGAANTIAQAIQTLNDPRFSLDALIVGRGGGSFEDLFCFNEAPVVRAIAASRLPVVTGIGHEPDYSLADAAADYSAQTPTAAAEYLVPDTVALADQLDGIAHRLADWLQHVYDINEQRFDQVLTGLKDALLAKVERHDTDLSNKQQQLCQAMTSLLDTADQKLAGLALALNSLSPLTTLARGFSMVQRTDGSVVTSVTQVAAGDTLTVKLQDGSLHTTVQQVTHPPRHHPKESA